MGWKSNPDRPFVELVFEFDVVREFHNVHVFTNNQFSREVAAFQEMRVLFSVGGEVYPGDPEVHLPLEDTIFEEPRNVSAKLHRRVAKFVKLQLYFASKWIMISEVSFDSTKARGNYSDELPSEVIEEDVEKVEDKKISVPASTGLDQVRQKDQDDRVNSTPIIIGVLAGIVVILFLFIVFILFRRWKKKKSMGTLDRLHGHPDLIRDEKQPLNDFSGAYLVATTSSDTGSSGGHSSSTRHHFQYPPKLDDNYNTPIHPSRLTPRQARSAHMMTAGSRGGVTPSGSRKHFPPQPRLQLPPPPGGPPPPPLEAVYTEPANYMEPYGAVKGEAFYGYGPVITNDSHRLNLSGNEIE